MLALVRNKHWVRTAKEKARQTYSVTHACVPFAWAVAGGTLVGTTLERMDMEAETTANFAAPKPWVLATRLASVVRLSTKTNCREHVGSVSHNRPQVCTCQSVQERSWQLASRVALSLCDDYNAQILRELSQQSAGMSGFADVAQGQGCE